MADDALRKKQCAYVVVLRARSAARFKPEEGGEFFLSSVPDCAGPVRFRLRTRWADEGHDAPVPRELWVEARGSAPSLDHAVSRFTAVARYLTTLVAFTANTQVGVPEPHIAYDASDGSPRREFLEVFVPDERGHPSEGRLIKADELSAVFRGVDLAADGRRISRAIHQYGLALRHWYFGGEWLALAHLYMAVETLTKAAIRRRCRDDRVDDEALAKHLGVDTTRKWKRELEERARRDIIFDGDAATYSKAKEASDGVEHGYLEFDEVHRHALAATEATFGYVRRAILRLLDIERTDQPELYERPPRDVQSLRKMIRGHFVGDGTDPAPPGQEYPLLEWRSAVQTFTREGDKFSVSFQERFTARCASSYTFSGEAMEVRARAEPGSPIRLDAVVEVPTTTPSEPPAEAFDLMRRAESFAETVGAHGTSTGIPPLLANVFGLGAIQLSLFEALAALLRDNRVAEALVLVPSLFVGTCRLQGIAKDPNPAGAAIRVRLDAVERQAELWATDAAVEQVRNTVAEYRRAAEAKGIEIPEAAPDIESTDFYRANTGTLRFAEEVARGDDLAIALHTKIDDEGRQGLYTQVSDTEMARGIAVEATGALMASTVAMASILNWPFDSALVAEIEAEAERIGVDQ
jgi:hypothetical protein